MSAVTTDDPTEVWVDSLPLSLPEIILSLLLLVFSFAAELASLLIHSYKDSKPVSSSVVRTPGLSFSPARQFGYNFSHSQFVWVAGLPRLHYLDVPAGQVDSKELLLLLHGEPFWSFCWTRVIPALSARARLIVPDLVGFGLSDKWEDWRQYSLEGHVASLAGLLDSLQLGPDWRVTVVGHNWGWMVGAALARVRPANIARLVILNTNNLPDGELEPSRYSSPASLARFLVLNSFFLAFRSSMNLLREHFPLSLLIHSLNKETVQYNLVISCDINWFATSCPPCSGIRNISELLLSGIY